MKGLYYYQDADWYCGESGIEVKKAASRNWKRKKHMEITLDSRTVVLDVDPVNKRKIDREI